MKLTSPFAPFISEELYQNLNSVAKRDNGESVHLTNYPGVTYMEKDLEDKMEVAQKVVSLTRSIRAKNNLKVRQPLSKIMVAIDNSKRSSLERMRDVILEEVNIKELVVLQDDSSIVNKSAKPNFKIIGPKYGKLVKALALSIKELDKAQIAEIELKGNLELNIAGENIKIWREDVEILNHEIEGWVVESEEGVTVAIDTELSEKLIAEGYAREFVNRIQNMRKDAGFDVIDRIRVAFSADDKFIDYIKEFSEYISNEVLADNIDTEVSLEGFKQKWKIGDYDCTILIAR